MKRLNTTDGAAPQGAEASGRGRLGPRFEG